MWPEPLSGSLLKCTDQSKYMRCVHSCYTGLFFFLVAAVAAATVIVLESSSMHVQWSWNRFANAGKSSIFFARSHTHKKSPKLHLDFIFHLLPVFSRLLLTVFPEIRMALPLTATQCWDIETRAAAPTPNEDRFAHFQCLPAFIPLSSVKFQF